MARIYAKELQEVQYYLDQNNRESKFSEFQDAVKRRLDDILRDTRLDGCIHSIFSRETVKSRKSIALKLYKWRKQNPTAQCSDIHDIAALTVTCFYPSDVNLIKNFISENESLFEKVFSVKNVRDLNYPDYSACHFILSGRGRFLTITCELQIKTILARDWGLKTHDLLYKPPADLDERLRNHMAKIGQVLRLVDDQSEIVKSLIESALFLDSRRRKAAQKSLISGFSDHPESHIVELLTTWETSDEFKTANNEELQNYDEAIMNAHNEHGSCLDLCRIVCLYALSRPNRDRNDFALYVIDSHITKLNSDSDKLKRSLVFQANALMALEEYEECLKISESIIKIAESDTNSPDIITAAKLNHAYYLSEAYYHRVFDEPVGGGERTRIESDNCGIEALRIINAFRPRLDSSRHRAQLMDTVGSVLISCGDEEDDVREGLTLCLKAVNEAERSSASARDIERIRAFYSLHERRAFARLVRFT